MTCGLNGDLEVEFLASELVINPYEVATRSGEKEFSHTKVEISRDDGELISERAFEYEPVLLRFAGVVQDRYMFHPEAVNLHDSDATLTLYDAEKVLDRGTINHHFQNNSLRDVVEYVLDRRDDPHGVITGITHPDERVQTGNVANVGGRYGAAGAFRDSESVADFGGRLIGEAVSLLDSLERTLGDPSTADTSLKFKKMTPFGAIKKTASSFFLATWVDTGGRFHYGIRGTDPNGYVITGEETGITLKEYNVTVGSGKLAEIILRGRYRYISWNARSGERKRTSNRIFAFGKAYLTDENGDRIEGRSHEPERPIGATNSAHVEEAARRSLVDHYMSRKNGNIILNGGASTDEKGLTSLSVGDYIMASGDIQEHCQRTVDTGIFIVQSVQHKLDRRRGWLVDVGVAGLPAEDVSSESWLENPETDEQWDDIDDWQPGTASASRRDID